MLTDLEVAKRLPAWHALADLFLDTQLPPDVYGRIAAALRATGYSSNELRSILETEVAPAFLFNLLDVAGEWAPWTQEEVRDIMLRSLRSGSPTPPLNWLGRRRCNRHIAAEWARIEPHLDGG
jgi:hypothetical protein